MRSKAEINRLFLQSLKSEAEINKFLRSLSRMPTDFFKHAKKDQKEKTVILLRRYVIRFTKEWKKATGQKFPRTWCECECGASVRPGELCPNGMRCKRGKKTKKH